VWLAYAVRAGSVQVSAAMAEQINKEVSGGVYIHINAVRAGV
jgi:hypothetical protein